MSFGIVVKGGTGAGRKRGLKPAYIPWTCLCSHPEQPLADKLNPGYLTRCIDCGAERERNQA